MYSGKVLKNDNIFIIFFVDIIHLSFAEILPARGSQYCFDTIQGTVHSGSKEDTGGCGFV